MRNKYQVFTPDNIVKKMLKLSHYCGSSVLNAKVMDLSCGDGAFLTGALEVFIKECLKRKANKEIIIDKCNSLFFGYEIDKKVYDVCIKKMNDVLSKYHLASPKWENIKCGNGLQNDNNKYDYVFGNPPYFSYKEMDVTTRKFLKDNFATCKSGKYDYSYAFIEKSIKILSDEGVACIIAPINMYKIISGKACRNFVSDYLSSLYDKSNKKIFGNVLINSAISVYKKENRNKINYYPSDGSKCYLSKEEIRDGLCSEDGSRKGVRFGDYYKVSCPFATLANNVFMLDGDSEWINKIEKEILKNAVSPKITRYSLNKKIIFPYRVSKNNVARYSEEEFKSYFPNAYSYLSGKKALLEKRDSDVGAKWFEYGRSQLVASQYKPKILINSIITKSLNPKPIGVNDVPLAGFVITALKPLEKPLEDAIAILESKSLGDYLKRVGIKMNGNSFRYSPKQLEDYII